MYCRKCGSSLPDGSSFCNRCGELVLPEDDIGTSADNYSDGKYERRGNSGRDRYIDHGYDRTPDRNYGAAQSSDHYVKEFRPYAEPSDGYYENSYSVGYDDIGEERTASGSVLAFGLSATLLDFVPFVGWITGFIFSIAGLTIAGNIKRAYGSLIGKERAGKAFSVIGLILAILGSIAAVILLIL